MRNARMLPLVAIDAFHRRLAKSRLGMSPSHKHLARRLQPGPAERIRESERGLRNDWKNAARSGARRPRGRLFRTGHVDCPHSLRRCLPSVHNSRRNGRSDRLRKPAPICDQAASAKSNANDATFGSCARSYDRAGHQSRPRERLRIASSLTAASGARTEPAARPSRASSW